jgi:Fur family transcriptional regulator, ferric uptake regulator
VTDLDTSRLVEQLRANGLRITQPRRAVLEVLAAAHDDHLTAETLHARAAEVAGKPIDPSTIYRIIEVLERAGSIYHVHLGHGPGVIHLSDHAPHHHLLCEQCGRTVDLPLDDLDGLIRSIETDHGFRADSVHFALVGTCLDHNQPSRNVP